MSIDSARSARPTERRAASLRQIARTALLPGDREPWPNGERLRWLFAGRAAVMIGSILSNFFMYARFREAPEVRVAVADLFLLTNNGLMAIDLLWSFLFLRRWSRFYPVAAGIACVMDMTTVMTWVQMTGASSSYFFGASLMLAMAWRFLTNYWMGLVATLTVAIELGAAWGLQAAGVLPRTSLFTRDVEASIPLILRETAATSMALSIVISFLAWNLLARSLQQKSEALEHARRELALAVDEAKMGRLSGTTLAGAYSLLELLGRGGMGEVYEARRLSDDRTLAIKVLHLHLGADAAARLRFRREAALVARLPAHCVAPLIELGTTPDGADYIAMERLRGEDLGALLRRRGRLALAETVALCEAIAPALEAAHDAGVVHRDLKPSNVFLLASGDTGPLQEATPSDSATAVAPPPIRVRLLDFGIARLYESGGAGTVVTESAALLGSPGYLAPEQAAGQHRAIGPSTDVFGLGAILYRCITGKPAFPSRSPATAVFESLRHHPPAPSGLDRTLPPAVDAVLALAMCKQQTLRYQRAAELARDLALAARDELPEAVLARAQALPAQPEIEPTLTADDTYVEEEEAQAGSTGSPGAL